MNIVRNDARSHLRHFKFQKNIASGGGQASLLTACTRCNTVNTGTQTKAQNKMKIFRNDARSHVRHFNPPKKISPPAGALRPGGPP